MTHNSQQIVHKLWRYCNILRDDGLSFPAYVEQLTYLIFIKMAHEQTQNGFIERSLIPPGFDWPSLISQASASDLYAQYGMILRKLSSGQGMLGIIFHEAKNKIQDPAKLRLLVIDLIDKENWSDLDTDVKGDAYEGLLEKNAQDTKSGAGQYFTPRPLIKAIVECVRPEFGERIYDPACGTCGFLLAAHDYIRQNSPLSAKKRQKLRLETFYGVELVDEVARLGAMNLLLHDIGPIDDHQGKLPIATGDSLMKHPGQQFDVILTNPPFGKKSSIALGRDSEKNDWDGLSIRRSDFVARTSNKQLNFLQHIMSTLRENGRAAVVVPDNVLFEGGAGTKIRAQLSDKYDIHTLLRLPPGLFYAQGIKTNVLFFDRISKQKRSSKRLWIYDLRNDMHFTLRTNRLERSDLDDFVTQYQPGNRNKRVETWSPKNPKGRWRSYSYEDLATRDRLNLDIFWLSDNDNNSHPDLKSDPRHITTQIISNLKSALEKLLAVEADLK